MLEFTLRHTIDCNPARFWELFLDADWTQALFDDGLNFRCEVGPVEEVAGGVRRREMRVVPKVDPPQGPAAGPRASLRAACAASCPVPSRFGVFAGCSSGFR